MGLFDFSVNKAVKDLTKVSKGQKTWDDWKNENEKNKEKDKKNTWSW